MWHFRLSTHSLFVNQDAHTPKGHSSQHRRNKLWSFHLKKFIRNYFLRLIVLRPSLFYLEASAQCVGSNSGVKFSAAVHKKDGKDCVSKGICCARKLFFVKGRLFRVLLFTCVGARCNYIRSFCWRDCLLINPGQGISPLIRKPYGDVFISAFPLSIFVYIKSPTELLLLLIDWPQWKSNLFDGQFRLAWREGDEINRVDCEGVLGVGNCSIEPEKVEIPSLFCVRHWPEPCEVPSDPSDIGTVTFHWPKPEPDPHFQKCERNPSS